MCLLCRKKGSIAKRFACNELELAYVTGDLSRVTDERLVSACQIESQGNELARLRKELEWLRVENAMLSERIKEQSKTPPTAKEEVKSPTPSSDSELSSSDSSGETSENSQQNQRHTRRSQSSKDVHPPGFREVRSHMKCFSGKKGEDDFQLWLEDYE